MPKLQENLLIMKRISFVIVTILACFISCTPKSVRDTLSDIETFIQERPDSALSILDTMDRASLTTPRSRAHHALLHAMALDKNFIDVSDDSIAQVAVDYFSEHGPQKYHARSLYYLGLAYYYQEEYNKAIVEFTKAEEVARVCDSLYLGFIKVDQAEVYARTYNPIEEVICLREALEINSKVSTKYYCDVVKLNIIRSLYNQYQHNEEAERLLDQLLSDKTLDDKVRVRAELIQAYISVTTHENPDFSKVVNLYEDIFAGSLSHCLTIKNYWAWAYSLNALGQKESAQELIEQLASVSSGTSSYWQYMIAKYDANSELALSHLEDYIKHNDTEVSDALKQSLALSQRNYYQAQSELSEAEAHNARLASFIIILISAFSALFVYILIKMYVKRQEEQKEKYLLYISEINRQLEESKREDYPALKKKYLALYRTKFETIAALYEQYIHSKDLVNGEISVYKKVAAIVDDFTLDYRNGEKFEAMLDEDLDNIMTNLHAEMPTLKKKDYAIFSLFAIGFDVTTISHLLNTSMNTIYIRKSRIKSKINEINPPHKEQFFEVLGSI
jgi:tetratricopeptide (TPR) repeat protein